MKIYKKIFLILSIISLLNLQVALADDYSSGSFDIKNPVISTFGGVGSSTNFTQINAGGQTVTGEASSTDFILRSGFLYYDDFSPKSQNWQWYSDFVNETPTTSLASENVAPNTIGSADTIKLRLTIKETADIGFLNVKYKLQYSPTSNFSLVYDVMEIGSCTATSTWCYADGGGVDDTLISTKTLSDADLCAASVGNGCGTHNESGTSASTYNHKKSAASEFEFTIKNSGAPINTTYFFRAFDTIHNTPVTINTAKNYPSLVTADANMTFIISGLNSGTATGGATMDSTTTSTAVDFGHLPIGSPVSAAQRMTITTNAASGYEIYVFQTQELTGVSTIPPVTGTNSLPDGWSVPGGATGAYGYHATDATLSGGSTRFAVNNTFAQLESAAREVAYNSGPVTSESNDMVYRTQITNLQPAGAYVGSITYVVVPVF